MATYIRYQGNRGDDYKPNDEFYTPAWIFEKMNLVFDIDVAAPVNGVEWIPSKKYFTKDDDGLNQTWKGNVWMNPPFSQSKVWVHKFMDHRQGIALLPTSKAKWFKEIWDEVDGIAMLPYDLKFIYKHQVMNGIFMPTGLFAFGKDNVKALKNIGIGRVR
jgi:phage N-6-adenine-methyltransferase